MNNLTNETLEFLWYSYFGVSVQKAKTMDTNQLMLICAEKAYLDMNRTLSFKSEERNNFCTDICDLIINKIKEKAFKADEHSFNTIHNEICNDIIEMANGKKVLSEEKKFKYGHAQKWLNMTLKYMWLMGFWNNELTRIKSVLHVPVDRYIIEAVWEKESVTLPILKFLRDGSRGAYNDEKVKSWSIWDEKEYIDFQTSLRTYLKNEDKTPIEWEGPAWIRIAEKVNGI